MFSLKIGNGIMGFGSTMRYLGFTFDMQFSFRDYVKPVGRRAARIMGCVIRPLLNIEGMRGQKRRLYVNTIHLVLLYDAVV